MIEPRLTSEFRISALRRRAEAEGAVVTIMRKGDSTSGAILVVGRVRGAVPSLFEPMPNDDGSIAWSRATAPPSEQLLDETCRKRAERDPDLWIVELDVASDERFAPLLGTLA